MAFMTVPITFFKLFGIYPDLSIKKLGFRELRYNAVIEIIMLFIFVPCLAYCFTDLDTGNITELTDLLYSLALFFQLSSIYIILVYNATTFRDLIHELYGIVKRSKNRKIIKK